MRRSHLTARRTHLMTRFNHYLGSRTCAQPYQHSLPGNSASQYPSYFSYTRSARTPWYLCPIEFMRRALILSGVVVLSGSLLLGQALFPKPVRVFGDPNFVGTAANPFAFETVGPNWVEEEELNTPQGIALDRTSVTPLFFILPIPATTGCSRSNTPRNWSPGHTPTS